MTDNFVDLHSELVIGLVSAVGTENNLVIDLLKERLGRAGYHVELVKVSSDVIPLLCNTEDCGTDQYKRFSHLMDCGNDARAKAPGNDSVMALGVATHIYAKRMKNFGDVQPFQKTAFIIDSLKRPEEVERLRHIYPSGFVLVGVHSEFERRKKHLVSNRGMTIEQADDLMRRDGDEAKVPHGQRVNKTFHLADFFVRISDNHDHLRCDITRMVELWFGSPFITPTFDEHAMFMAFAAALRSADLSRQVGAVVTRDSQILSTGANECPAPGGGLYWSHRLDENGCIGDVAQGRDFKREAGDSNRAEQVRIIEQILKTARGREYSLDPIQLKKLLEASAIQDLTEYGRVVHAEMEALLSCSRNGLSTVGATLFCTTFPCHNCAKHIIAAGIHRVVYVEPYPKSKALEFHDDAIATTENRQNGGLKVVFEPFVGIGPRRFFDLFSMHLGSSYPLNRKIKETGKPVDWSIEKAHLRIQLRPVSYLELEEQACRLFGEIKNSSTSKEEDS
jgi:deoxycytidylate deaminase